MGFWLDRWLSTTPLFLLILFFLGILAGFLEFVSDGAASRQAKRVARLARLSGSFIWLVYL